MTEEAVGGSLLGKIPKKRSAIDLPVVQQVLPGAKGMHSPSWDFSMLAASQGCTCTFPFFPTSSGRGNPAWSNIAVVAGLM